MKIWLFLFSVLVVACVPGALAAPFADRAALKAAVDSCLAIDATGVACCNSGANCGAAGTDEMDKWDTSSVTDMNAMFNRAGDAPYFFNADISGWDVSSVTDMNGMFNYALAFNADLSGWDVSSVTYMNNMFYSARSFNADLSSWNVSSVTYMNNMFWKANSFDADITSWDTSSLSNSEDMFVDAFAWLAKFERKDGDVLTRNGPPSVWHWTWTQVGADIDGEAAGDHSGFSVSMSSDGTRVAIGAYGTTALATRRPRAGVRGERRDVDPGGRRHRRRGCG